MLGRKTLAALLQSQEFPSNICTHMHASQQIKFQEIVHKLGHNFIFRQSSVLCSAWIEHSCDGWSGNQTRNVRTVFNSDCN